MANGLVVADTGISVGGRAVLGANLGRVQVGLITHTSDTALATKAAGGSQMGAAVSMVIPTTGIVRTTLSGFEGDETENSSFARVVIGVKIGSDSIIWANADAADGTATDHYFVIAQNASSVIYSQGVTTPGTADMMHMWDVAGTGMSTGTQDVEVWLGDNAASSTGECTVTGTTTACRFLVEVIDGT